MRCAPKYLFLDFAFLKYGYCPATVANNFLPNSSTELNTTNALYDLDYRHFDPILGRMNGVDPMADKYSSLTPYNYSFNSPTMHTDASGADPDFEPNYWFEESMQRRAANKGPVNMIEDHYGGNPLMRMGPTRNDLRNIGGGHITRGSGGHWADGLDLYSDMIWMSRNVFEAVHNVDLSDPDTQWNLAMGFSTPATGTIEYSRDAGTRHKLTLENGRVTDVVPVYSRQQMNMIASANKFFGLDSDGPQNRIQAPWMAWAITQIGTQELLADGTLNPRIRAYFAATDYEKLGGIVTTTTPWCAAFANWCFAMTTIKGSGSAHSDGWSTWGDKLDIPTYGAIGVNSDGHTSFYLSERNGYVMALGGNQSNSVKITSDWWKVTDFTWYWPKGAYRYDGK